MKRYKVLVHAENLKVRRGRRYQKGGFYTTVFVSGWDSSEAGQIAIEFIGQDHGFSESLGNDSDDPPRLSAVEVVDEPDATDATQRTGLAFYTE